MSSHKKEMLAELRLAISGGYHESSALAIEEFEPYREDADFQGVADDWKTAAK